MHPGSFDSLLLENSARMTGLSKLLSPEKNARGGDHAGNGVNIQLPLGVGS